MNRELFLSLGITILTSATLFVYFRQRFKNMEHKVNTIFQMVQEHVKLQQMGPPQMSSPHMPQMINRMMQQVPNTGVHEGQVPVPNNLIDVSDDESSDGETTDEDSDNETSSETSNQEATTAPAQNIQMNQNLKQISVTLEPASPAPINLEEKLDLDDVSSLDDDEDEEEGDVQTTYPEDGKDTPHVVEETPNYAKMTVAELKKIASKKGITGYNKLRKQGLVDAILDN